MLREAVNRINHWLHAFTGSWWRNRLPAPELFGPSLAVNLRGLRRVVLTEEVSRTLFEEFAGHRQGSRGEEEIGWVLLGIREEDEVRVVATLPAGASRSASTVHVSFDSDSQALGARVVRQKDKRITIVGVVHTHPGSLRHPSEGDYHGDSLWVGQLRGGEGVFGIGTADGARHSAGGKDEPAHLQAQGQLLFSWYALGKGDKRYRRLPVEMTAGADLARPLHSVWPIIETHAPTLDRLYRQLAGITLEPAVAEDGPALALNVKLAEPGTSLRVVLDRRGVRYYLGRKGQLSAVDFHEDNLERALYLILAELAGPGTEKTRRPTTKGA